MIAGVGIAGLVVAWFVTVVVLTGDGFFRSWGGIGPLSSVQVAIVVPPTLTLLAGAYLAPMRAFVRRADPLLLAAFQCLRVLGAAHLVYWGAGIMAGSFALPVGLGNLVVAGLAVTAVVRLGHQAPDGRRWLWVVTLVGTAEFLMTIALAVFGFFAAPTRLDPTPSPAGYMSFLDLPLAVFPTFLIPLFLSVHAITALRLTAPENHPSGRSPVHTTASLRITALLFALVGVASAAPIHVAAQTDDEGFTLPTTNPAAHVRQAVSGTWIDVRYHRPRVKGREIFGALVPWDRVWRTGSDNATQIGFGTPVTFGGQEVQAGTYELFTVPGRDGWTVILQPARQQWGSYGYDPAHDAARVEAEVETLSEPVESFTITVEESAPGRGAVHIAWDRTRATVPIAVDVRSTVVPRLEAVLAEAERPPYFLAAMFYYEHGLDYRRAAELMAKALEASPGHIGMLHRQAIILDAAGDRAGAIAAAERSLEGAQSAPPELKAEYTRLNEALLARLRGGDGRTGLESAGTGAGAA